MTYEHFSEFLCCWSVFSVCQLSISDLVFGVWGVVSFVESLLKLENNIKHHLLLLDSNTS